MFYKMIHGLAILAVSVTAMAAAAQEQIIQDGKSACRIVLQEAASPSEQTAAKVLQSALKGCTGVELPILTAPPTDTAPMIVLGCGAAARALGVDPAPESLGEQGYVIRAVPPHLVIAGTPAAGTLYGVYDFLETYAGVRWYTPDVTKMPETKALALPAVDRLVKPAFAFRDSSYHVIDASPEFSSLMRDNRGKGGADNPFGIQYQFDASCHSYFHYISPEEYFGTHPEYFSEIGGVRRNGETQLCLTNPDVLEIVSERMLKSMAASPNTRQFNFSQMDWYSFCECPKCAEINARYGTPGATQFWFVNQLAERTAKVFPDKLVSTLAYTYTEELPKDMPIHPNVAIWLCHMFPSCDSHPIATCPLNADYYRRAQAWAKACKHLYIWHYITDFAHYFNPFPNFRSVAADLKTYRDIGVEGLYLQGNGSGGGEFHLLRPYYVMKLAWNPDADPEAIVKDFLDGYYGAAGAAIYDYFKLLHDKVTQDDIHMHLYVNPAQGYLTDDVMQRAAACFDQAETAVKDNPELLDRVRVARMPIQYARFFPRNGYTLEDNRLVFNGDIATYAECTAFLEQMKQHKFDAIRELGGDPSGMLMLSLVFNTPMPLETISNAAISVQIAPFLSARALRITDRASGE